MRRVCILVEGQTEEAFIGQVLAPHLLARDVHLTAITIVTKNVADGPNKRGGIGSWSQVEQHLRRLLRDTNLAAVTTMFDYYGMPGDTPGMAELPVAEAHNQVVRLQETIDASFGDCRFRSHLVLHEFEALLYTDPGECGSYLENPKLRRAMQHAVHACGEPEAVNDNPNTAPSKRIIKDHPGYQKKLHGPAILQRIGLPAVRKACPHFDDWVTWLENVGHRTAV